VIYLSPVVLLLSLLILISSSNIPIFAALRPPAKWTTLASAIGLIVSLTFSVVSSPGTAEKLEAQRQVAETKAAEDERAKAEAEKRNERRRSKRQLRRDVQSY
jgi:hypothetical protein